MMGVQGATPSTWRNKVVAQFSEQVEAATTRKTWEIKGGKTRYKTLTRIGVLGALNVGIGFGRGIGQVAFFRVTEGMISPLVTCMLHARQRAELDRDIYFRIRES
eukprot:gene3334-3133_t